MPTDFQMIQLSAPIFLNVEFSRSFVKEYPVCAREKNIVMPYPTTDPDVLRGHLDYASSPFLPSALSHHGHQAVKVKT